MNCGSCIGIKLVDHAMKIVQRVPEKRLRNIVEPDELQFEFGSGKGSVDALFVLKEKKKSIERRRKACTCVC